MSKHSSSSDRLAWRSDDTRAVMLIGGIFAFATLAFASFSPGIIPDSTTYLDVARSLLEGQGLQHRWAYWDPVYAEGSLPTPTSLWPPGYSIAIAAVQALGIDELWAGRLVSIVCAIVVPILVYLLLRSQLSVARAVLVAVASSLTLAHLKTSGLIATEQLFLALATFAMLATSRAIVSASNLWWFAASVAASLSFTVRYVGLAIVCCVPFLALVDGVVVRERQAAQLAKKLLVISAPAVVLVGTIFARNYYYAGTVGQPWPGSDIFWSSLFASIQGIVTNLVGERATLDAWNLLVLRIILLAAAGASGAFAIAKMYRWYAATKPTIFDRPANVVVTVTALVFTGAHVAITFLASMNNGMNVEPRYVYVIYPWLLAMVFYWVLAPGGEAGVKWLKWLGPPLCVLFVSGQSLLATNLSFVAPNISYVALAKNTPIITWLRQNLEPDETVITTRGAEIATWIRNKTLRLPRIPHSSTPLTWEHVDALADRFGARYLVHGHFEGTAKYDDEQSGFLVALNDPAGFPSRNGRFVGDFVVYRIGSRSVRE